ncbi:hypothetical protein COLO4_28041 [Corchorus olitorius]|uniref:Uncharacterized protein n=1 Tax=Corchorus olitorius TaxID=93759 RepID=A0A1R3HN54_9ROSI|nr:hypothetical protein COLO4_28041 [Corchorus olitorius]
MEQSPKPESLLGTGRPTYTQSCNDGHVGWR